VLRKQYMRPHKQCGNAPVEMYQMKDFNKLKQAGIMCAHCAIYKVISVSRVYHFKRGQRHFKRCQRALHRWWNSVGWREVTK
jgi:hypothetical protein